MNIASATSALPKSTDVFVAGGGPAGLAAAIAARLKGLSVVVAERATPAIDKACGEGLMPDAVEALRLLGVTFSEDEFYPFHGIRFCGQGKSVEATFPYGLGCGVRRTTLHRVLTERAEQLGVRILWDAPVSRVGPDFAVVRDQAVRCRFVVGADGENSPLRRSAGLDRRARDGRRFGFRRHFGVAPWTDCVEVNWGERCQIYVTPVGRDRVNVAVLSKDPNLRLDAALHRFPELAARLRNAPTLSAERGCVSATRRLKYVCHDNFALIGDASGSVDAVTGEGMSLAFQQALALADAMESGNLAHYQKEHDRIRRRPAFMADVMLLMDTRELLRRRVFAAFTAKPEVFADLLALHVAGLTPRVFATTALTLGWGLLTS